MKIVAIRPAPLGDSLLIFHILAALRTKYPNAHITFLGSPATLPLAKAWGLAEETLNPAHVQWYELLARTGIQSAALRDLLLQADLAICWLDDSDGWIRKNLLAIGVRNFILAPEREPLHASRHIVEYLAEPLGLPPIEAGWVAPTTAASTGFCAYNAPNAPIAIHPGCSEEMRRWPAASFAAIVNQLVHLHYPVLLLVGPSEAEILKEVQSKLSTPPQANLLSVLQNAPLLEVARRLQECRSFLGNDSGISHLAGLLGIPMLVLFGPSNPAIKHALGPSVAMLRAQPLKRLPVRKVLKRLLQIS